VIQLRIRKKKSSIHRPVGGIVHSGIRFCIKTKQNKTLKI